MFQIQPAYPESARIAGREGYAVVELTIDENGFVTNPIVTKSKGGKAFERAALKAAEQFRYAPQFVNGDAVQTEGIKYRFSFDLRD